MSELFKEAIATAKAVRASALANAKAALEEAFTPRLQSMLGSKLREELDDEFPAEEESLGQCDDVTSGEISEILKELEGDEDPSVPQAPSVGDIPAADSTASIDTDAAPTDAATTPTTPDGVKIVEAPVMVVSPGQASAPVAPTTEPAAPAAPAASDVPPSDSSTEEDPNLDELLAELNADSTNEEIDLNELLSSLSEGDCEEKEKEEEEEEEGALAEAKKQFSEAVKTIEFLRTQLNEVNLLNAKLLYTNKLFKARAFDNNTKMKIIEAFDLTKSVREVKLTYNNLSEAFNLNKSKTPSKKSPIVEGFASQSIGTTKPAANIVAAQVNDMASRFQKLAGIKK